MTPLKWLTAAVLGGALCIFSTACASSDTAGGATGGGTSGTASGGSAADVTQLCGKKPIKMVLIDGYGADPWRKTVKYQYELEASKCKNVTATDYFDAQGDVQKYNTAFSTFTAQGYNAIITFDDFGASGLGAIRQAYKAGVAVVPYVSNPGGTPGVDYTAFVNGDKPAVGKGWAKWLNDRVGTGTVVEMGGTPGNPASAEWLKGLSDGLAEDAPGITLADKNSIVTNWAVADTQKAAASLLSKYPDLGAIALEYGQTLSAVLSAYESAGVEAPPVVSTSSTNGTACDVQEYQKKYPDFQFLSYDGLGNTVLPATRKAIAGAAGIDDPESDIVELTVWYDSANKVTPICNKDLPDGADLSSTLSEEQILKALS